MKGVTDPRACRALWRCVLVRAVLDLCGTGVHRAELRAAELWVGDWPSPAFRNVCEMAGVDSDRTHSELKRLLPMSPKERAAEIKARRRRPGFWEVRDAA